MTTETDIANLALDIVKEAPIASLEDQRPIGKWLKRNFAVTRDSVLSDANWNFALKRAILTNEATEPAFGWRYSYLLPSDCLRLEPLTVCGNFEGSPIPHEIENRRILTNKAGPLRIRYVYRNVDYGQYSASFLEALSAKLAMKMAHWLSGKVSYVQVAEAMYEEAMRKAWLHDAMEGTSPRAADQEWIEAR